MRFTYINVSSNLPRWSIEECSYIGGDAIHSIFVVQETLVNLAALIVGLVMTPVVAGQAVWVTHNHEVSKINNDWFVSHSNYGQWNKFWQKLANRHNFALNIVFTLWSRLTWTLFICFTAFHLIANHRAVSVVALETLNKNRLHILMQHYLASGSGLTVHQVNIREPILTSEGFVEGWFCFTSLFGIPQCRVNTCNVLWPWLSHLLGTHKVSFCHFFFSFYLSL